MSDPACYLIREGGTVHAFRDYWGAHTTSVNTLAGPEATADYIRTKEEIVFPYDEPDFEGGILVDMDQQVLLCFDCDTFLYQHHLRAPLLELQSACWPNWKVAWAERGIVDFLSQLGTLHKLPPRYFCRLSAVPTEDYRLSLSKLRQADTNSTQLETLLVLETNHRERFGFGFDADVMDLVQAGEQLLTLDTSTALVVSPRCDAVTSGCIHIIEPDKELRVWNSSMEPGFIEDWEHVWPGWKMTWLSGGLESLAAQKHGTRLVPRAELAQQTEKELKSLNDRTDLAQVMRALVGSTDTTNLDGASTRLTGQVLDSNEMAKHIDALVGQYKSVSPVRRWWQFW